MATAVTQETGAVALEQATVRVTGTLRWDAATGDTLKGRFLGRDQ